MTTKLLTHDHSRLQHLLANAFSALQSGDPNASYLRLDQFWGLLAVHIRAENLHLLPTLLRASREDKTPPGSPSPEAVEAAVARLREDHDFFMKALTPIVKRLREAAREDQAHAGPALSEAAAQLETVRLRVETHNASEEDEVYPWLDLLLDDEEQDALRKKVQGELRKLPARLKEESGPNPSR